MSKPTLRQAKAALKRIYGYSGFRPGQEQAVARILSGGDLLAILPTGGGKSICYQIPALISEGLTIVISPLISLMKDQVDQLTQLGVPAQALNSTVDSLEARDIMRQARSGELRLLYIAPERLDYDFCRAELWSLNVGRVIIDEAHCVSQWGHDFRPSYLAIGEFISGFAVRPTVAAFTATATDRVRDDIISLLGLTDPALIKTGFDRPNLEFSIVRLKKNLRAAWIRRFIASHPGQSGIIYCSSRRDTEALAGELGALCYHAGMDDDARRRAQDAFINDANCLICATNAFGMGIDKPDVRFVIHYHMPASVEAYWQEAGRAGRDGLAAECVLLSDGADVSFWTQMIMRDEGDEQEKDKRRARLRAMADYLRTRRCLRACLVGYFGEELEPCGMCSNCLSDDSDEDITRPAQMILSAVSRCGERVGKALITKVLSGANDKRVYDLKLDRQSTYGIMNDVPRARIGEYIDELVAQNYLELTEGKYPVLRLTPESAPVLRGETQVMARMGSGSDYADELERTHPTRRSARSPRAAARMANGADVFGTPLYERLRGLRRKLAGSGIPAFMVFGDSTLVDMAHRQPRTRAELMQVSGMGERRLRNYGDLFLQEIAAYVQETGGAANEPPVQSALRPAPQPARSVSAGLPQPDAPDDPPPPPDDPGRAPPDGQFSFFDALPPEPQPAPGSASAENPFLSRLASVPSARSIAVRPVSAPRPARADRRRMASDLALFLRTRAHDFLADFPDYTQSDVDDLIVQIRQWATEDAGRQSLK